MNGSAAFTRHSAWLQPPSLPSGRPCSSPRVADPDHSRSRHATDHHSHPRHELRGLRPQCSRRARTHSGARLQTVTLGSAILAYDPSVIDCDTIFAAIEGAGYMAQAA